MRRILLIFFSGITLYLVLFSRGPDKKSFDSLGSPKRAPITLRSASLPRLHKLRPVRPDPMYSRLPKTSHPFLLLFTKFRSGSTFLGEAFNQNPGVFYEFEPLHPSTLKLFKGASRILGGQPYHTLYDLHSLYIQQVVYNCSVLTNCFLNILHKHWKCGRSETENVLLLNQPECDDRTINGTNIEVIRQYHCKHRPAIVFKVIRLRRLMDLRRISALSKANFKIVRLTRDPRAMMRSRSAYKDIFYEYLDYTADNEMFAKLANEAYEECSGRERDETILSKSHFLKENHFSLTHEDMSQDHEFWIKRIHEFAGIPVSSEVNAWLKHKFDKAEQAFETKVEGTLNTHKNSSEVLGKTKRYIHKLWYTEKIRNVDRECAKAIRNGNIGFYVDADRSHRSYKPFYSDTLFKR